MDKVLEPGSAKRPRLSHRVLSLMLLLAAVGILAWLPVMSPPLESFDYYGRSVSLRAPDFALRDTSGQLRTLRDFRGRFVYLMFGYLSCERVCHSQALTLHMLSQRLSTDKVRFLYLGMDPARDTAERIEAYFDARAANFTGLIARDMAEAQTVAAQYHAYFSTEPAERAAGYRINHPGFIYLIDPTGEIRVIYTGTSLSVDRMLEDLSHLYVEGQSE